MKNVVQQIFTLITLTAALSCANEKKEPDLLISGTRRPGSYSFDKRFLLQQDTALIELKAGSSAVIVSARYQGKVFTSTADVDENNSFGWINYKAFSAKYNQHMNAYGGENRLWLGPEGGQYSLFFRKGDSMIFDNWRTPPAFDVETWQVVRKNSTSVTIKKNMSLANYTGTTLNLNVQRTVVIQNRENAEKLFDIELPDSVKLVGYSTINTITNTGKFAWSDSTGMPCIWILDMFNPSPSTNIIIPFKPSDNMDDVATTDYFGEIGDDRLRFDSNVVYLKADGRKRGKMGIQPEYALSVAGSYDAADKLLTVIYFSVDSAGRYLNQEWNTTSSVYNGDAMNAYNDGPLDDGTQLGPFYELESVSPAASLKPGEKLEHIHNVYHFTGNVKGLDQVAQKIFGRKIAEIRNAFR